MCEQDWFDRLGQRIVDALDAGTHEQTVARAAFTDELRSILRTAVPTLPRSAAVWRAGNLSPIPTTNAVQLVGRQLNRVSIVILNTSASAVVLVAPTKEDAELQGSTCVRLPAGASITLDTTAPVWVEAAGANASVSYFNTETDA